MRDKDCSVQLSLSNQSGAPGLHKRSAAGLNLRGFCWQQFRKAAQPGQTVSLSVSEASSQDQASPGGSPLRLLVALTGPARPSSISR